MPAPTPTQAPNILDWPDKWPGQLLATLEAQPCVLVTLNLILGSAPRESGSRMIVTSADLHGSIGGGNLEYTAIQTAREMLRADDSDHVYYQVLGSRGELTDRVREDESLRS